MVWKGDKLMKISMLCSPSLFVKIGNKLLYTRKLHKWKNSRFRTRIKALKQMGVFFYYD